MKLSSPMIVVTDMERSLEFYKQVLGLDVILDFGANKTLTSGLALQTIDSSVSIHGVSALSAFMIRISTSLRSVRICRQ